LSNYTKATDFASKDALLTGNPAKIIKGTEIDTEFNNIATAISTKAGTASPTFTGTPAAPTAAGGTNTTQIATTAFVTAADTAAITAERTATATLTNKTLTGPIINSGTYTNYTESTVDIGTVTSSHTINLTNGTVQIVRLTASTACTFTMPTATAGKSFILFVRQAATTGNGTATFSGVKWSSFGTPTITATANRMDIFTFVADGTNWYGSFTQGYTL
jgi:hypothetical protein